MRLACNGLPFCFEKRATIVTPSRLLAGVAGQQFVDFQLQRGMESWERPALYHTDAWLMACWQEARFAGSDIPALLSPAQERVVWQSIIEAEEPDLFDVASTARLASSAFRLTAEWDIPIGGNDLGANDQAANDLWSDHEDARHFVRWYVRFRQRCRKEGWITRSDVWRLLPAWISGGWCERQPTVFAGFETISPSLRQTVGTLGKSAAVEPIAAGLPQRNVPAYACSHFLDELEHAARWARAAYERHPNRSVAVLIPDLAKHRSEVERSFNRVFYPSGALHLLGEQLETEGGVFHLNAARALTSHPVVASALLLLQLAKARIAMADACAALRSPYILGAELEKHMRARADLTLRRRRDIDVSLRDIEYSASECVRLKLVWPAIRNLSSGPEHRDPPAWSKFIREFLEVLGWPGEANLTTQELDAVELWKNAVSSLASLGLVSGPVSHEAALGSLRSLLSREGTEPGDWSSPVQILDASHAGGLHFDSAFLAGMSEENWPPALHSSALVPLKAQRAHGVPGSSRQSAYELDEGRTESLFCTAPSLAVTFSGQISSLIAKFVQITTNTAPGWRGKLPIQSYVPAALDELDDSNGPAFAAYESTRGGTGIVRSQSLCPFRAFAEYRLRSNAPEEACFGFDSRDRGQFLHKALQTVWDVLKTQDRLRATRPEDLQGIVRSAVLDAVRDDASSPFHELTTDAERERLEKLILEWLDLESSRSQPFTVDSVEQKRSYNVPGLRLDLRVDRMDRLKNGSVLLIDYKSGKQTAGKLEGERPAEPQLLVYAAAVGELVDGVFFGQLKPRELRAVGFSRERHFPGRSATVKKDWSTFIEQAISNVEAIALGFVRGEAVVDPIRGACDYCSQKPFCRIREKSNLAGESDIDPE